MTRVLVLVEPGRNGAAAVALACGYAECDHAVVTVVGVVPSGMSGARCGNSALDYDAAVTDAVARDVDQACARLRESGADAARRLLADDDHQLGAFAAAGSFDIVLVPARRRPLRAPGHPALAQLWHVAGLEVRLVDERAIAQRSARN